VPLRSQAAIVAQTSHATRKLRTATERDRSLRKHHVGAIVSICS